MVLTYNNFKKIVDYSGEKLFNRIAEAISTSDNAALVSMFDDKLIVLDEDNEKLFLCDYLFENGILSMKKFEEIQLTENDDSYFDQVVDRYFDLDDDQKVTVEDLMTGFNLKFKNESNGVISEAKTRKYRKIMESPRIRAIKRARDARNMFNEEIKNLMEEGFMKHVTHKVDQAKDSVPAALNKVSFKPSYGEIKVNTDIGGPAKELITLKDNTNVMDVMKTVAVKVSDKWKSDSFRNKFEKMINKILATESFEMSKDAVLGFLEENKELFLLNNTLFEELMTKTALMFGETDTDSINNIFEKIMRTSEGRRMKSDFYKKNSITEEKIEELNSLIEQGEDAELPAPESDMGDEESTEAGNDLESEEVDKIIDIFDKIKKQLDDDSPESEYIDGLISSLDSAKVSGIEDSKMKEVVDFLSSVEEPSEDDDDDDDDEETEEVEV